MPICALAYTAVANNNTIAPIVRFMLSPQLDLDSELTWTTRPGRGCPAWIYLISVSMPGRNPKAEEK
jgi:hypothetical protein